MPKRTHRDRRRTPSSGVPSAFVVDEPTPTPPPQQMPEIAIGRSPSPDETSIALAAMEAQLRVHTAAFADVWEARHLGKRVEGIEQELRDNTRSTVRTEALVEELLAPLVNGHTAKLDTCLHYIASSSHVASTIAALGDKMDTIGGRIGAIETAQASAAVRFEEHDLRDQEIEKSVHLLQTDVTALKQRHEVEKATGRVRRLVARQVRPWWYSGKGVAAVLAAAAAATTAIYAAIAAGGCE